MTLPPPTEEWTDNHSAPWKCVGGPFRGKMARCHCWAYDFLVRKKDGSIETVRYVRNHRVNMRTKRVTFFLRYFGTGDKADAKFNSAARKAAR